MMVMLEEGSWGDRGVSPFKYVDEEKVGFEIAQALYATGRSVRRRSGSVARPPH